MPYNYGGLINSGPKHVCENQLVGIGIYILDQKAISTSSAVIFREIICSVPLLSLSISDKTEHAFWINRVLLKSRTRGSFVLWSSARSDRMAPRYRAEIKIASRARATDWNLKVHRTVEEWK